MSQLSTVLILLAFCHSECSAKECPRIVSRQEWGARPSKSVEYLPNPPVQFAFIHHSAGRECFSRADCTVVVRGYQGLHMDSRGWDDIGYSFIIGGDGTVFEGRGWDRVGAHTLGYNDVGLGFCLSGDFSNHLPPEVQAQAARDLIECGVGLGKLRTNYTLRGHREMNKRRTCPGDALTVEIRTWPHYQSSAFSECAGNQVCSRLWYLSVVVAAVIGNAIKNF